MADAFHPRIDDAVRQTLVRIIQSYLNNGDLWLACPQCDKPFSVLGGRTRIAGDNVCTSKAAQNPALQYPAGWRRRAVCLLAQSATHSEHVVACDDDGEMTRRQGIGRIGMIADVNDSGALR